MYSILILHFFAWFVWLRKEFAQKNSSQNMSFVGNDILMKVQQILAPKPSENNPSVGMADYTDYKVQFTTSETDLIKGYYRQA